VRASCSSSRSGSSTASSSEPSSPLVSERTACAAYRRERSAPAFVDRQQLGVGADDGAKELSKRLRCLVLDDPRSVALGNEPVRIDGEVVGRVTSGGYGYTVERSIAYAYLPADVELDTAVEVDIFGQWIAGVVSREPLFDPKGERVRNG